MGRTSDYSPKYRRVADDLRRAIRAGIYQPGSTLPSEAVLMERYRLSRYTVRNALAILRAEGLIDVPGPGRPTTVRMPVPRIRREASRYQWEKDQVTMGGLPSDSHLARDVGLPADRTEVTLLGDEEVPADSDLAAAMEVTPGSPLRRYTWLLGTDGIPGRVAHHFYTKEIDDRVDASQPFPRELWPDRGDSPWPRGTMYQLARIGIEVDTVIDTITARMPLPEEVELLRMVEGVPLLVVRKISRDTSGVVREVVDVLMSADRTELVYANELKRWVGGAAGEEISDAG